MLVTAIVLMAIVGLGTFASGISVLAQGENPAGAIYCFLLFLLCVAAVILTALNL
jgi:hypothetical protein